MVVSVHDWVTACFEFGLLFVWFGVHLPLVVFVLLFGYVGSLGGVSELLVVVGRVFVLVDL